MHVTINWAFDCIACIMRMRATHFLQTFWTTFLRLELHFNEFRKCINIRLACRIPRKLIHGLVNRCYDNLLIRLFTCLPHTLWMSIIIGNLGNGVNPHNTNINMYIIYQTQWVSFHFLSICCAIRSMSFRRFVK